MSSSPPSKARERRPTQQPDALSVNSLEKPHNKSQQNSNNKQHLHISAAYSSPLTGTTPRASTTAPGANSGGGGTSPDAKGHASGTTPQHHQHATATTTTTTTAAPLHFQQSQHAQPSNSINGGILTMIKRRWLPRLSLVRDDGTVGGQYLRMEKDQRFPTATEVKLLPEQVQQTIFRVAFAVLRHRLGPIVGIYLRYRAKARMVKVVRNTAFGDPPSPNFLASLPCFAKWSNLSDVARNHLVPRCCIQGETILHKGEPDATGLHILAYGSAADVDFESCSYEGGVPRGAAFVHYAATSVVGNVSLLTQHPQARSVRCTSHECLVWNLSPETYDVLLEQQSVEVQKAMIATAIESRKKLMAAAYPVTASFLNKFPLFAMLPAEATDSAVRKLRCDVRAPGDTVYRQGDGASCLYLLIKGTVKFVQHHHHLQHLQQHHITSPIHGNGAGAGAGGRRKEVLIVRSPAIIGDMTWLQATKRKRSCVCVTMCDLYVLSKEDLRPVLAKCDTETMIKRQLMLDKAIRKQQREEHEAQMQQEQQQQQQQSSTPTTKSEPKGHTQESQQQTPAERPLESRPASGKSSAAAAASPALGHLQRRMSITGALRHTQHSNVPSRRGSVVRLKDSSASPSAASPSVAATSPGSQLPDEDQDATTTSHSAAVAASLLIGRMMTDAQQAEVRAAERQQELEDAEALRRKRAAAAATQEAGSGGKPQQSGNTHQSADNNKAQQQPSPQLASVARNAVTNQKNAALAYMRYASYTHTIPVISHFVPHDDNHALVRDLAQSFVLRAHPPRATITSSAEECDRIITIVGGRAVATSMKPQVTVAHNEAIGYTLLEPHRWKHRVVAVDTVETLEIGLDAATAVLKKHGLYDRVLELTRALLFPEALDTRPNVAEAQRLISGSQNPCMFPTTDAFDVKPMVPRYPTATLLQRLPPIKMTSTLTTCVFSGGSSMARISTEKSPPPRTDAKGEVAPMILGKHHHVYLKFKQGPAGSKGKQQHQ